MEKHSDLAQAQNERPAERPASVAPMKLARSFQLYNSSPVVASDGVVVGDISGRSSARWSSHRSKRDTWTFVPNDEGKKVIR